MTAIVVMIGCLVTSMTQRFVRFRGTVAGGAVSAPSPSLSLSPESEPESEPAAAASADARRPSRRRRTATPRERP